MLIYSGYWTKRNSVSFYLGFSGSFTCLVSAIFLQRFMGGPAWPSPCFLPNFDGLYQPPPLLLYRQQAPNPNQIITMSCSTAIIILNWNGWEYTQACLQSLQDEGFRWEDVILVDNRFFDDGSPSAIKSHFPTVQLWINKHNLGFTGGNNVGIQQALHQGYTYIMLLNNDTEIGPGFWKPLLKEMEASSQPHAISH